MMPNFDQKNIFEQKSISSRLLSSKLHQLSMYLVYLVIVIVILAVFTFYLCPKLQDKHCREHFDYDYDKEN